MIIFIPKFLLNSSVAQHHDTSFEKVNYEDEKIRNWIRYGWSL